MHHPLRHLLPLVSLCLTLAAAPVIQETGNKIIFRQTGVKQPLTIIFASDLHLGETDDRDQAYRDNYLRLAQCRQSPDRLPQIIAKAQKADLLILGGDILSFPSLANLDFILKNLAGCTTPWRFVNGNHDWHFEGLPGTETALRDEWSRQRLAPLYQNHDPLMSTLTLKGLKIIFIDNGTGEILPQQLDFFRRETADGIPAVLVTHIPLFVPGRGLDYCCGHPDWNAAHDPHWQIERRPRWPENGHSQTTLDFCNAVWNAPALIGVVAGHTHVRSTDLYKGKIQLTAPFGGRGEYLELIFR